MLPEVSISSATWSGLRTCFHRSMTAFITSASEASARTASNPLFDSSGCVCANLNRPHPLLGNLPFHPFGSFAFSASSFRYCRRSRRGNMVGSPSGWGIPDENVSIPASFLRHPVPPMT